MITLTGWWRVGGCPAVALVGSYELLMMIIRGTQLPGAAINVNRPGSVDANLRPPRNPGRFSCPGVVIWKAAGCGGLIVRGDCTNKPMAAVSGVFAGRWWCMMSTADRVIQWSTALAVLSIAAVAAVASYEHAYDLVGAHGEAGWTARLVPLTVDGLIWLCPGVVELGFSFPT